MAKNRDGKPTAFQIDTLKKAGIAKNSLNGIKTYRDAENAIKRIKRAKDLMAKSEPVNLKKGDEFKANGKKYVCEKGGKKPICKPVAKKQVKRIAEHGVAENKCEGATSKNKKISGIGIFRVRLSKSDIIEALLLGFAHSIIYCLGHEDKADDCCSSKHDENCCKEKAKKNNRK